MTSQSNVRVADQNMKTDSPHFAHGFCFYKIVWIFTICSVIGVIIETIFCLIFKGYLESRQGMLYGPFNQIYGFGAILLGLVSDQIKSKNLKFMFVICAVTGGLFEIICSMVQQYSLGSVSWDYNWMPFSILGGRTNLLYMAFFGVLGVCFIHFVYPLLSNLIERFHLHQGIIITWVLVVFMSANLILSAAVVSRWTQRQMGVPPESRIDQFVDSHYPDDMLAQIYPSMIIAK